MKNFAVSFFMEQTDGHDNNNKDFCYNWLQHADQKCCNPEKNKTFSFTVSFFNATVSKYVKIHKLEFFPLGYQDKDVKNLSQK